VAWGDNQYGQATVPVGLSGVVAVAAGWHHSVALRADGSVVCWGRDEFGATSVPAGLPPVSDVRAGAGHTLVRLRDGTARAWGLNTDGQAIVPSDLGEVVRIDCGFGHNIAELPSGQLRVWGATGQGRDLIPAGLISPVAFAAGAYRTVAVAESRDSDADGLGDGFEERLGTSAFDIDSDADGLSDRLEVLSGLDPTTPTEAPDGTVDVRPAIQLTTFTLEGGRYRVESSVDLLTWVPAMPVIDGVRGYTVFQLTAPDRGRFYRVVRLEDAP
jgi:hypothetical protein